MLNHYNYIITGAGCAGSSLLMRMMREPFFNDKKILVIDQSPKTTNDRTWCFWEKQPGIFEPIVHHHWNKLNFFSDHFSATLATEPYRYKMIRGIDLYTYVKNESRKHDNIEWRHETVKDIQATKDKGTVITEKKTYTADHIFNSILFNCLTVPPSGSRGGNYLLLQHFKGWLIETTEPVFDPTQATFMDFRVGQENGTTFMYMLPTSPTTALVEYTLFSEKVLPQEAYENALRNYIASYLDIKNYTITHEESGVIPMTNARFPLQEGRIVYMGTAGGQVKASSGYAFQFIQKRTESIVRSVMQNDTSFSKRSFADKKFHLYDSVLLNVLYNKKMKGADIFARIFRKNPVERVLQFLDNETGLLEDLQIIRSVPSSVFLPATFREMMR